MSKYWFGAACTFGALRISDSTAVSGSTIWPSSVANLFEGVYSICSGLQTLPKYIPHTSGMMTSSNGNIFRVTGPLCGEFTGTGEFPPQRPVTQSFDVFFGLGLNKRLSKQPWGWWFETPAWSLWRQFIARVRNIFFSVLLNVFACSII